MPALGFSTCRPGIFGEDSGLAGTSSSSPDRTRALCLEADVTRRGELDDALVLLKEKWGSPFGLINNAAIDTRPNASADVNGPFENFSETVFDEVMDVNVKGVMLCCQVFGAEMAKTGAGSIVNISSESMEWSRPTNASLPIPARRR